MRIGLSTSSIEMELNGGVIDGIGHYTQQIYDSYISHGLEITPYAYPLPSGKRDCQFSKAFPRSMPLQLIGNKFGLLPKLNPEVDLFHATDFKITPMHCPVVLNIWDSIPIAHPEWLRSGLGKILAPKLLKSAAQYADQIICGSHHAAQDAKRYFGIHEDKISVIPWGIPHKWLLSPTQIEIENTRHKYNLPSDFILTVGTVQERKNYMRLIEAFQAIPQPNADKIYLVIVGKLRKDQTDFVSKAQNQPNIIHIDNVHSDMDLRHIYHSAKSFIFPTLYEGFGMPVLEAFAARLPVAASNVTSIPEVAGDGAILFDPYDVNAITQALKVLMFDEDHCHHLRQKGQDRLKMFQEQQMIEATLALYNKLL